MMGKKKVSSCCKGDIYVSGGRGLPLRVTCEICGKNCKVKEAK